MTPAAFTIKLTTSSHISEGKVSKISSACSQLPAAHLSAPTLLSLYLLLDNATIYLVEQVLSLACLSDCSLTSVPHILPSCKIMLLFAL